MNDAKKRAETSLGALFLCLSFNKPDPRLAKR